MQNIGKPLIFLASASPRRSALLRQIGVEHHVRPVNVDETTVEGESPADYVQRLAALKATTLWERLPAAERLPVLGSDTTVAVRGHILGKPQDADDARRMLGMLSGRCHQVYTSVALRTDAAGARTELSVSDVHFRELRDSEIDAYWRSGEPRDKAGGYAIQGIAAAFIERIEGSYSGIMGLPLFETARLLSDLGWTPCAESSR